MPITSKIWRCPCSRVADKIASEGGDKKLPVKLAGVVECGTACPVSWAFASCMYFQLANFLSDALHILRPRPSPRFHPQTFPQRSGHT